MKKNGKERRDEIISRQNEVGASEEKMHSEKCLVKISYSKLVQF